MFRYSLAVPAKTRGIDHATKFYGITAAGKPIIVIGDRNGGIFQIVQQRGCGIVAAPGNVDALIDALELLSSAPGMSRKWARLPEQCLTGTLLARKRFSDGADCSISSVSQGLQGWFSRRNNGHDGKRI